MGKLWELENDSPKLLLVLDYIRLVGDPGEAILLSQIAYWFRPSKDGHSKLRVRKRGELCLAKTAKDLSAETGLAEWMVRKKLRKLAAKGFLTLNLHRFNGFPTYHIRLNSESLANALKVKEDSVLDDSYKTELDDSSKSITETTTTEITNSSYEVAVDTAKAMTKSDEKKKVEGNVDEIVGGIEGKRKTKLDKIAKSKGAGPSALVNLWKGRVHTMYGGFSKDLTAVERGQLRHFANKVGENAPAVLDYAVQNWEVFVFEAKVKYGIDVVPAEPVVGFLLKYHDVAVGCLQSLAKKSESVKSTMSEVQPLPPKPKPVKHQVSKETVLAALAALKKPDETG